jgi:uncharacterized protein (DUF488 family)
LARTRLFSIGHSNHDFARFVELLRQAGITAVADVRSQPFSQRCPQFNRADLQRELQGHEIAYAFLGDQLGGRPQDASLYDADGRVDYERVRRTAAFRRGIGRLSQALEDYVVVMVCSEEDPLDCHRGLMITPALVEEGIHPAHLRGDGAVESAAEFEERLLAATKMGAGMLDGLFAEMVSSEERQRYLAEAYRAQARRRAFRLRPEESAAGEVFTQQDDME